MSFTTDNIAEMDLLLLFDLHSSQTGIRIHTDAKAGAIAAAQRLFEKGIITEADGGYLTNMGILAAEHAQSLFSLLNEPAAAT